MRRRDSTAYYRLTYPTTRDFAEVHLGGLGHFQVRELSEIECKVAVNRRDSCVLLYPGEEVAGMLHLPNGEEWPIAGHVMPVPPSDIVHNCAWLELLEQPVPFRVILDEQRRQRQRNPLMSV